MLAALNIADYTNDITLILVEASKYFVLLVFCVLAIRLWRRWAGRLAGGDLVGLFCALGVSLLALVIGYFSMRQSLGMMYSHYGMSAFRAGRLPQALSLFEVADGNWHTADTTGQKGVCLLLLGHQDEGRTLIAQARVLRKSHSQFEDFYEGLIFFMKGDMDHSVPLLETASSADEYRWSVVKIFAVINLEANRNADAARLMQPFMQVEVTEPDQAYVVAALNLADGKKSEARMVLDKFPAATLPEMWKGRFEKLRAELNQ